MAFFAAAEVAPFKNGLSQRLHKRQQNTLTSISFFVLLKIGRKIELARECDPGFRSPFKGGFLAETRCEGISSIEPAISEGCASLSQAVDR
jgi:hypothetical protein